MAVQQYTVKLSLIPKDFFFADSAPYSSADWAQLYVEPIRKEWPACLFSIAAIPDPPSTQEPTGGNFISPPGPTPMSTNHSALQPAVGINKDRTDQSNGISDMYRGIMAYLVSYGGEARERIDEVVSPEVDEEMEIGPFGLINYGNDSSMESSLILQDTSLAKSDQVPDLSGLVAKVEPNAIFDGTYSTVFRGFYDNHEVSFSDSYVWD
jgi:hypothetical protein